MRKPAENSNVWWSGRTLSKASCLYSWNAPASAGSADAVLDAAIEAGADDVKSDASGHLVTCAFEDLGAVSAAMEGKLGEAASVKAVWRPTQTTALDEERAAAVLKLIGALEEDDDVQNVYSNFEVSEAVLAKLTAA